MLHELPDSVTLNIIFVLKGIGVLAILFYLYKCMTAPLTLPQDLKDVYPGKNGTELLDAIIRSSGEMKVYTKNPYGKF